MTYTPTYTPQSECAPKITEGSILLIPISEIYSAKQQRLSSKGGKTIRMLQMIKKYGVSSPISVIPTEVFPGITRYMVAQGEEIWRAACLAGLTRIPCLILQNTRTEAEIEAIFAQIGTKTQDFFEHAVAFRHLIDNFGLTQEEISRRAGLSQSSVANKLRLLQLTAVEQKKILLHGLSERHARALLRLKSTEQRLEVLDAICQKNLNVACAEALVESYLSPKSSIFPAKSSEKTVFPILVSDFQAENTQQPPRPEGRRAPKLVLHTLQPLYNSLERTLSIFRKTGRTATLNSEETEKGITITIQIPRP